MKPAEIARHRLVSQQITGSKFERASEMVKWFGAVQAQEYALSKWGLGLRLQHVRDQDVENDLSNGKILRTHILRPTWHFVNSEDIRWMLMLSGPRVHSANAYMYRNVELETKLLNRCQDIFAKALEGGKNLTRNELAAELRKKRIQAEGFRLAYIVMYGELEGIVCSGPRSGNHHTYMLLEERVPPTQKWTREEALAELTRRYFFSRGPSTVKDFSTWSGLTTTDCKKGVESIAPELKHLIVGDERLIYRETIATQPPRSDAIHLLPIYDEYIMGYKDRSAISQIYNKAKGGGALAFDSTIILDGQIVGSWKRIIRGNSIEIEYEIFRPDSRVKKLQLKKAIERFRVFTAASAKLTIKTLY